MTFAHLQGGPSTAQRRAACDVANGLDFGFEERRMPRYYFHLERGDSKIPDVTGCEAVSDMVVVEALGEILTEYADELILSGIAVQGWTLSVVDHSGRLLLRMEI